MKNFYSPNLQKNEPFQFKNWLHKHEGILLAFIFLMGAFIAMLGLYLVERGEHFGVYVEIIGTIVCGKVIIEIIEITTTRQKFIKILCSLIEEKNKTSNKELLDELSRIISNANRMNSLGIIDLYEHLDFKEILEKAKERQGGTLIIQRLCLSSEEFKLLRENVAKLIEEYDTNIQLLLYSPTEAKTIRRRLQFIADTEEVSEESLDAVSQGTAEIIEFQLKVFDKIKKNLPLNKRDKLHVKFHNNFVVAALTSYDDKIIHCPYLSDRSADEGIHIEVRGKNTRLYKEWSSHFKTNWENASFYEVVNSKIVANKVVSVDNRLERNCKISNIKTLEQCLKNDP